MLILLKMCLRNCLAIVRHALQTCPAGLQKIVDLQSQELEVERELCQGMLRLCAGLSAAGALPSRPAPFNEEEHLFDQRFSCFNHSARPEPLLHQQYAESIDPTGMLEARPDQVPAASAPPVPLKNQHNG